jgi:hypothetical protein
MIIKWKKSNPKVIPLLIEKNEKDGKTGQIKGSILLMEGINCVKDEEWKAAAKNLDDRIDKPFIEVIEDSSKEVVDPKNPKKKVMKPVKGLEKFEAKEAVEMIDDCFSIPTLEFWLDNEGRNEIRAAIAKKIEDINDNNLTKEKSDKRKKSKKKKGK